MAHLLQLLNGSLLLDSQLLGRRRFKRPQHFVGKNRSQKYRVFLGCGIFTGIIGLHHSV
jgi:hypothetical protein